MGELRLHAIGINEIRDMFGASDELAARLRGIASHSFRVPEAENRRGGGLLSKLGPLFKRDFHAPLYPHDMPLPSDVENLIAGRFIAPDRLNKSWQVLDAWVDECDWGTFTFDFNPNQLEGFDFALTKAGLPSHYSLGNLMSSDPQIGLRAAPGMRIGYSKNTHAIATAEHLRPILNEVEEEHRASADQLNDFLTKFEGWSDEARQQGRLLPDLFVVCWETARPENDRPNIN